MNKYKYVATDINGKHIKGTFVANNEAEMKELLLKNGYYVISSRQASNLDLGALFSISGKIKTAELSQFCNQFSAMITAGISIIEAVHVCAGLKYSKLLRSTLQHVEEDLKQGYLLSEAMSKHPKVFPAFFTSMIYVGETAGCLDTVLIAIAEYYVLENKTKKKIISSLIYPIILILMLIVVVVVMMLFVIPTFIDSFSKMDVEMPGITMAIFNLSNFFKSHGLLVLAGLAGLIVILWLIRFLPSVRLFYDRMKITLPVFKKINYALFTSRFCRSLSLLLGSGADSLSALLSLKKTITNRYLAIQFDKVIDDVKKGFNLSQALPSNMDISPVLVHMIVVGEKTGELDNVLNRTGPYFAEQAEASLNAITTIVQPAVLVLLGGTIALLFVAMYAPILNMITGLKV